MRRGPSALTLPRHITPASINIGDTVKVAWETNNISHTRTAQVASREYENGMRVFYTENGTELFRWHPSHNEYKITLLSERPAEKSLALFDLAEIG